MDTSLNSPPEPQRGTASSLTGMDAVEIKVTIRPDQELRAERALQVNEDTADIRLIYFYDTPSLDLFEAEFRLVLLQTDGFDQRQPRINLGHFQLLRRLIQRLIAEQ